MFIMSRSESASAILNLISVKLKNKHVLPLINAIFDKAKVIFKDIERGRANKSTKEHTEPKRKCSDRLYKVIVYLVKNEDRLKAFLDSPYGVMQNNNVEEKFRELDILRNGMIASDTSKGLIILQSSIHSIRPVFYITLILELI